MQNYEFGAGLWNIPSSSLTAMLQTPMAHQSTP